MKNNSDVQTIQKILSDAGKKSNLYLFYNLVIFLLFGSLSVFDILTYIKDQSDISAVNLILGIIFGIIALISLIFIFVFLLKPKQLLTIDFKNTKLIIKKSFNKTKEVKFDDIYFLKDTMPGFYNFVFKNSKLFIYTHDGECIKVKGLANSSILKITLNGMLNISDKNIYEKKSFKLFFIRIYHYLLKFSLSLIPRKKATLLNSYEEVVEALAKKNIKKVLLVESGTITRNLLDNYLKTTLEAKNIQYVSFSDISTNPTTKNCEDGKKVYLDSNCEAIIAIGGGSPLDCAKGIAILVNTKKHISKFKGAFKVHHKVPLIVAIPTTCGTGSETTFVTVITDEESHTKFTITSNRIVPTYAYLDANLIKDLPLHFIGSTAMDAFSHALESYLNISRTHKSKKYSIEAMKLIYENLLKVKDDPTNLTLKANLLKASYIAGNAFSIGLVGPIHALSHALGGKYNLGHGYLNAILLPRFLNVYLFDLYKDLNDIALGIGLTDTKDIHKNANNLVKYIKLINECFNFKQELDMLNRDDIKLLAEKAYKESHLLYSSKHFVTKEMYEDILVSLLRN